MMQRGRAVDLEDAFAQRHGLALSVNKPAIVGGSHLFGQVLTLAMLDPVC
jgi:hypothetical protein